LCNLKRRLDVPNLDIDPRRLAFAQTEPIIAEPNLHGIAKRCKAKDLDGFTFEKAHFEEPLTKRITTLNSGDDSSLPSLQLIERGHSRDHLKSREADC